MAQLINNKNKRNYIINGNFDFWQRGVSLTTIPNAVINYLADRFAIFENLALGWLDYEQSTDVPDNGSRFSSKFTVNSSTNTQLSEFSTVRYVLEGSDTKPLSGKTFTISFKVKASVSGTYCVSLRNGAFDRYIIKEYTIDVANTWETKTITLTHDETGTWNYDNGAGFVIYWTLSAGSNVQSTPDTWQNGNNVGTSNQVDMMNNPGATFQLSQVMLNEGAVAAPFQTAGANAQDELAMCQRYYEKSINGLNYYNFAQGSGTQIQRQTVRFATPKRVSPTAIVTRTGGNVGTTAAVGNQSVSEILAIFTGNAGEVVEFNWTANTEL